MAEPLTIAAAAPLVRSGELTPSELLEQCLRRIDLYEPAVQAWAYLDRERARRDAARSTDEAKAGRVRGPLHGVPVGVKDIIDVFDMPTGCGSKLWANSYARRDATVVERLRQAGAVIVGKTVTTPYAYLDPPPTRNPWDLTRTPGGSSSGSAAAVACGMCLAALGTQTGGSTIRPASYCGIAAFKPSFGRLSRAGVLPLAPDLDHVGLMARTVSDLRQLYDALTFAEDERPGDVVAFVELAGEFRAEASPAVRAGFAAALDRLRERTEVVSSARPPTELGELTTHTQMLYAAGAADTHADRLVRQPDDYPPRIGELVRAGVQTSGAGVVSAKRFRRRLRRRLTRALRERVYILPSAPDEPPGPDSTGSPSFNSPWTALGLPVLSVPAGWTANGLPHAAQLVAGWHEENALFAHATSAELAYGFAHRLPPVPE